MLLTSKVPCSQPWRGGRIPLSGACALVESMPPEAKERMAESFRQAYPGVRLLERMASIDGEAFRREYQGEFVPRVPTSAKETLALQCQLIVERLGGSITIEDRHPRECVVHVELDGERFEDVSTSTLRKIFYMHHYGAGARKIANALREARGRPPANLQEWPTNPCAEVRLTEELLCLGGPKHGQFVACSPFGRFDTYGEERHQVNPFRPSRIERTSVQIHTYEPRKVVVGGRTVRVMVLEGEDVSQHIPFLTKMQKLLGGAHEPSTEEGQAQGVGSPGQADRAGCRGRPQNEGHQTVRLRRRHQREPDRLVRGEVTEEISGVSCLPRILAHLSATHLRSGARR